MSPIEKAVELSGGATRLASLLGVSLQRLSNWGERGVPSGYCHAIELATGGRVTVEELRPDLPWGRMPDPGWPVVGGRPVLEITRIPA